MSKLKLTVREMEPQKDEWLRVNLTSQHMDGHIHVFTFLDKDTNQYVGFIPALDLTGYGPTEVDAHDMLKSAVEDFFHYLLKYQKSKIQEVLTELGWHKNKFFNKKYLRSFIDVKGQLQGFNFDETSLKQSTLTAA